MNAGHFNRRIRIERQDGQLDAWGQPLDAWQPVAELWAAIIADRADSVQRLTLEPPAGNDPAPALPCPIGSRTTGRHPGRHAHRA
jgi:hypothetical protein